MLLSTGHPYIGVAGPMQQRFSNPVPNNILVRPLKAVVVGDDWFLEVNNVGAYCWSNTDYHYTNTLILKHQHDVNNKYAVSFLKVCLLLSQNMTKHIANSQYQFAGKYALHLATLLCGILVFCLTENCKSQFFGKNVVFLHF